LERVSFVGEICPVGMFNACKEKMKKIFLILVGVVFGVVSQAQSFFAIDAVNRLSDTEFQVSAGAQTLRVSPYLYEKMKGHQADYLLVTYVGTEGSMVTVAARSQIQYMVCNVDSIGIDDTNTPLVYLSNGRVYKSQNRDWLTVQPGQRVAACVVNGETKVLTRKWHTVPRETELTTTIPVSPAPTAPVVRLTEENKQVAPTTTEKPTVVTVQPATATSGQQATVATGQPMATTTTNTTQSAERPTVRIVSSSR